MKKIIITMVAAIALTSSCKKEDVCLMRVTDENCMKLIEEYNWDKADRCGCEWLKNEDGSFVYTYYGNLVPNN